MIQESVGRHMSKSGLNKSNLAASSRSVSQSNPIIHESGGLIAAEAFGSTSTIDSGHGFFL